MIVFYLIMLTEMLGDFMNFDSHQCKILGIHNCVRLPFCVDAEWLGPNISDKSRCVLLVFK